MKEEQRFHLRLEKKEEAAVEERGMVDNDSSWAGMAGMVDSIP